MSFASSVPSAQPPTSPQFGTTPRRSWRAIDIIVACVLSVAIGLIFWVWNTVGVIWGDSLSALTPGLHGLALGIWLLGGPMVMLVIRKPGAAFIGELLAASVSASLGSVWCIGVLYSGLAQGLGAELIFLIFAYRRFGAGVAMLAGAGAGLGAVILELFMYGNLAKSIEFNVIYGITSMISGAILAGLLSFFLVRALAQTGALDKFPAGRERMKTV